MSWLIVVALVGLINSVAASWWDHHGYAVTITSTGGPIKLEERVCVDLFTVTINPTCTCPLETVVTRCASSNTTSHATPTTHTADATPSTTCGLSELPSYFFLRMSNDSYLYVNESLKRAVNVRYLSKATAFRTRSTNDGSITGISQLAFGARSNDSSVSQEYGAWIQTLGIDYGGPIEFFEDAPQAGSGYSIVTAGFSTYLCRMSLITWMFHDLS